MKGGKSMSSSSGSSSLGRFLALFVVAIPCVGLAQTPRVKAVKITKPPVIDGDLGPEEWNEASSVTGFIDPITGAPTSDQTEAWIAYDDAGLYVAFGCFDSHPEAMVAREIRPGSFFDGEDTVTLRINPFGNRGYEGRSRFTINLLNTQSEEISGGRAAHNGSEPGAAPGADANWLAVGEHGPERPAVDVRVLGGSRAAAQAVEGAHADAGLRGADVERRTIRAEFGIRRPGAAHAYPYRPREREPRFPEYRAAVASRSGGLSGAELYVIVGDPNVQRTRDRVSVKLVWPF